ncbi:MAG: GNAT family N-acetyltransferase [Deltaproteobacteria bacterium]|nr:GNAT family N-acetyltransferase [Deltaproteobacteria bacterium]
MVVKRVENAAELARCLAIRQRVFVLEQGVPQDLELDDKDPECTHFLASEGDVDTGTARLLRLEGGKAKVQRVAVSANQRKSGVGRALMRALEAEAKAQGCVVVVLSSQVSAIPFYERLGYEAQGPVYDDAGIPHRDMSKQL